ncbi:surfeit locus 1 [Brachionus plicatilis]|uniref:SURF1-like protein n=1 Tax=Brachionus plicatilis TaxID=10195 RepID=A0A3M7TA45_BRAPC|nr:surfeit locus 1 [Brachionus plicatilis]
MIRLNNLALSKQIRKLSSSSKSSRSNLNQKNPKSDQQKEESKGNFASYAFFTIPSSFFALGVWQIKRRNEKLNLIKSLEERMDMEPSSLPINIQDLDTFINENQYRPFRVKGYFLNSKEILLTTRFDVTSKSNLPGGYVITPFVLSEDTNKIILINRGFVPFTSFSESARSKFHIDNQVELAGFLRADEPKCQLSHLNKPPNEWHIRDLKEMSQELGTEPIFLDQVKPFGLPSEPTPTQTQVDVKNDHLSYIFTWFGLSLSTFFIWLKYFAKIIP